MIITPHEREQVLEAVCNAVQDCPALTAWRTADVLTLANLARRAVAREIASEASASAKQEARS